MRGGCEGKEEEANFLFSKFVVTTQEDTTQGEVSSVKCHR